MPRPRGSEHTTLTETAEILVKALKRHSEVKMIAPGIIDAKRSGKRYITAVYTRGGVEFIISGQGVQKVSVHLVDPTAGPTLVAALKQNKSLAPFLWGERSKML